MRSPVDVMSCFVHEWWLTAKSLAAMLSLFDARLHRHPVVGRRPLMTCRAEYFRQFRQIATLNRQAAPAANSHGAVL